MESRLKFFIAPFIWTELTLPLLSKDLHEQSMQRKTYVYRSLFAIVVYSGGLWIYSNALADGIASLGHGASVLWKLMWLQIGVTASIAPLLVSSAVAGEKERDTLDLLIVTKLSLREIVLEKFAAHFVSIATLQLLALPLMALAYPMGGVEAITVLGMFAQLLCVTAISVGCAIFCSCWAYSTQGAFLLYVSVAPLALFFAVPKGPVQQALLPVAALYGCLMLMFGIITAGHLSEAVGRVRNLDKETDRNKPALPKASRLRSTTWVPVILHTCQIFSFVLIFVLQAFPWFGASVLSVAVTMLFTAFVVNAAAATLSVRSKRPNWRPPSDVLAAIDDAVHAVNDLTMKGAVVASQADRLCQQRPIAWLELRRPAFRLRTLIWTVLSFEVC